MLWPNIDACIFYGKCRHEDTESSESSNSEAGGDHVDVANGDGMPLPEAWVGGLLRHTNESNLQI